MIFHASYPGDTHHMHMIIHAPNRGHAMDIALNEVLDLYGVWSKHDIELTEIPVDDGPSFNIIDQGGRKYHWQMGEAQKISMFTGEFDWLSNFYVSDVVVDNIKFRSVEHAYQTFKTEDPGWRTKIRNAKTPGASKRLGLKCPIRKDWEDAKVDVMRKCVLAKFTQNEELKQKLLDTGDTHLEEGNTWGDKFWGTVSGHGKNMLGRILMEVRDSLSEDK